IGVAAVLLLAAYWYFLYRPKAAEMAVTSAHVDSLDKRNQQAKADIAQGSLQKLRAQATEYDQSLKVMRQLVPRSNEVPALPGEQFDTYRYKLGVTGAYPPVGQFLSNVGSLNRIIAPVTMTISLHPVADKTKARIKKGESLIDTQFQVQTYVARSTPYAPPAGKE